MGLLISGGMLIQGNIPNIIAAGKMGITSKEWARSASRSGLPDGRVLLYPLYPGMARVCLNRPGTKCIRRCGRESDNKGDELPGRNMDGTGNPHDAR